MGMKKILSISLALLVLFSSCATIIQPKFKKKANHKELIAFKYGKADTIQIKNDSEIWSYNKSNFTKSSRKVIFNNQDKIISNKKNLSPTAYIFRYLIAPVVAVATVAALFVTVVVVDAVVE